MVNGYSTTTDSAGKTVWQKRHKNGETTKVILEEIPNSDRYFAHVEDPNGTVELGRLNSKSTGKREAKKWMRNHPKGVEGGNGGGNGLIPGAGGDNGFF